MANGFGTLTNVVSGLATGAQAVKSGTQGIGEAQGFILGMEALQKQTNEIQLAMGRLNFEKVCVEGFAKFLKEMGKGFVQQ